MRFFILSLGCPKNTVESEGMRELLNAAGHSLAASPEEADVLIVNTCAFIDVARDESLEALRELADARRPEQYLIAAGCMPELYSEQLPDLVVPLDGLISTRRWQEIPRLVDILSGSPRESGPHRLPEPAPPRSLVHPLPRECPGVATAYVKIAEGCDAPCAFCTIPQIKGPFQSKPKQAILKEVGEIVEQGVKEIILIAQDTTSYGADRGEVDAFPALIEDILESAPSLAWLRIMYAYAQRVTPRLIQVMAERPRALHYLDLPLQHAHPQVLRRMNRPHDVKRVRSIIDQLRSAMPDIAIRTSFIVGYPGETDEEFRTLLDFMDELAFDRVGVFVYSPEQGTQAAALPDQVPQDVKADRYRQAMELQQKISLKRNERLIGRELEVLVEGIGEGISVGRSYRDAPEVDGLVIVQSELPVNEFARIRITEALEYDLIGQVQQSPHVAR
jgi:ribosomal protein S12 methylthiotransferase